MNLEETVVHVDTTDPSVRIISAKHNNSISIQIRVEDPSAFKDAVRLLMLLNIAESAQSLSEDVVNGNIIKGLNYWSSFSEYNAKKIQNRNFNQNILRWH